MTGDDTPDIDLEALLGTFAAEAEELIEAMERNLLRLETAPDDVDVMRELFRNVHTLKGNASCVAHDTLMRSAHVFEEVLQRLVDGTSTVDADGISLMLANVDVFRALALAGPSRPALTGAESETVERLCKWGEPGAAAKPQRGGASVDGCGAVCAPRESVRVPVTRLDRMLDLVGEIAIARGRMTQLIHDGAAEAFDELVEVDRQIDGLQAELQELVMQARMIPVGPMFRQQSRTVREVAIACGKQARLSVEDNGVEVDTRVVEQLRDVLTHMIRNAVDHGIETPVAREAAGKPAAGEVRLSAEHDGNAIVITVSDDGRGLDRERIAERARVLGLGDHFSDDDLWRLIFTAEFSTAAAVTEVSGRGVGMDVVLRTIESLRGTISIATRAGEGTAFTIRLPLTLAVIDGFGVAVGDETYVLPMECVVECAALPADIRDGASGVIVLRDETLPFVRLREHFARTGGRGARESAVIVEVAEGSRLAIIVDELLGNSQAVIKPLGGWLGHVPGVAASSILGSGRVALVLDATALYRQLTQPARAVA